MRTKFYLAQIKNLLVFSFRNYQYRLENYIGYGCKIHKTAVFKGNITLGNNVIIGKEVTLEKNVKIGSHASIRNIVVGDNTQLESYVQVSGFGDGAIKIGKECYIGVFNVLDCSDKITIGDFVHIAGPSTGLWTHSSAKMCLNGDDLNNKTPINRPTAPIIIENNVYIGGNCTIYPGITIKHHAIIAPNSVVNRNVESYTLIGGVPARLIKKF